MIPGLRTLRALGACLVLALGAACGDDGGDDTGSDDAAADDSGSAYVRVRAPNFTHRLDYDLELRID